MPALHAIKEPKVPKNNSEKLLQATAKYLAAQDDKNFYALPETKKKEYLKKAKDLLLPSGNLPSN